ncbi:hypothetical protein EJ08DRAFT_247874, partial [Tothia fuscella]
SILQSTLSPITSNNPYTTNSNHIHTLYHDQHKRSPFRNFPKKILFHYNHHVPMGHAKLQLLQLLARCRNPNQMRTTPQLRIPRTQTRRRIYKKLPGDQRREQNWQTLFLQTLLPKNCPRCHGIETESCHHRNSRPGPFPRILAEDRAAKVLECS